jgi:hypothetical protein
MHGAAFADKAGAELLKHPIGLKQCTPESICVVRLVGRVCRVGLRGNRVW